MKTTIFTPFKVLGVILLAIAVALLFLAAMQFAQTHLASVGWHGMASVGWHGMASVGWHGMASVGWHGMASVGWHGITSVNWNV
jgi:hypothetical protein